MIAVKQCLRTVIAILIPLCACISVHSQTVHNPNEEDDIREAIFRSQLTAGVNFLSIDGKDPSEAFMKRFEGSDPPTLKLSRARKKKVLRDVTEVVDRKTDRDGTILKVGNVHWIDQNSVTVEGGNYCGSLCNASGIFHVVREKGIWVVKNFDVQIIS